MRLPSRGGGICSRAPHLPLPVAMRAIGARAGSRPDRANHQGHHVPEGDVNHQGRRTVLAESIERAMATGRVAVDLMRTEAVLVVLVSTTPPSHGPSRRSDGGSLRLSAYRRRFNGTPASHTAGWAALEALGRRSRPK